MEYTSVFLSHETSSPDLTELNSYLQKGYFVHNQIGIGTGVVLVLGKFEEETE